MTSVTLSKEDTDKLVESLRYHILHASQTDLVGIDFCKTWPVAKSILQLLAKVPALGVIVSILIAIGDAYSNAHCKT